MENNIIQVSKLSYQAITEEEGWILRDEIINRLNYPKIIIDFEGIMSYSTIYFHASIGHFIVHVSEQIVNDILVFKNLPPQGQEVLDTSIETAKYFSKNRHKLNKDNLIFED